MSQTKPLFIFEMANNHMGDPEHGLRIIREMYEASAPFADRFRFGFKLQYRSLDTFIHPDYRGRDDIKYVKRFEETRLAEEQLLALKQEMSRLGFLSICTPFDEASVDRIEAHGFEVLKIASCSLTDWPLLERVAISKLPVIASAAGASLDDIDKVVSFFEHRRRPLSLMHCVAEYPTPLDGLQLGQIALLRARYPKVPVGYSTHENPEETTGVQVAAGLGAAIFEKHVGVAANGYGLNAYSASPAQVTRWLQAASQAYAARGETEARSTFRPAEIGSLRNLRRGAFAARRIEKGEKVQRSDLTLAIPLQPGQVTANDLSKYVDLTATEEVQAGAPLFWSQLAHQDRREKTVAVVHAVRKMIEKAGVVVPGQAEFEISHHFGIDRFHETGATIISFINREYCKKLIVLLPGQSHPEHYHIKKEETFLVLSGRMRIVLNGVARECSPGDILVVERGAWHSFSSEAGAIMEELSSTHYRNDSVYREEAILGADARKTQITYWLDTAREAARC